MMTSSKLTLGEDPIWEWQFIAFLILFEFEGESSHAMKTEFQCVWDIFADTGSVSKSLREWCKEYSNM